ncbi:MAG TPA: sigma-70 family RNA polymerase sigma factor [Candidatus Acidoferrales bacterium]
MFRIARSKVVDHLRRRAPASLDESYPADSADLLAQVAHSEETARLSALIRALDGDEQELIRLRYVAELPFAEMASLLGRNEAAVKKSLYRLLGRLHKQLDGSHE